MPSSRVLVQTATFDLVLDIGSRPFVAVSVGRCQVRVIGIKNLADLADLPLIS